MTKNVLKQEIVKRWFRYDSKTGNLIWRLSPAHNIPEGRIAGTIAKVKRNKTKYINIVFRYKHYRAHNLVWIFHNGDIPDGFEVDHEDHNGLSNLIGNLRLVTCTINMHNKPMQNNNTSGEMGVCYCKGKDKWRARINAKGKRVHLGYFRDKEEAINVRRSAVIQYGYHKNHGNL